MSFQYFFQVANIKRQLVNSKPLLAWPRRSYKSMCVAPWATCPSPSGVQDFPFHQPWGPCRVGEGRLSGGWQSFASLAHRSAPPEPKPCPSNWRNCRSLQAFTLCEPSRSRDPGGPSVQLFCSFPLLVCCIAYGGWGDQRLVYMIEIFCSRTTINYWCIGLYIM